jgi:hypothetical protein
VTQEVTARTPPENTVAVTVTNHTCATFGNRRRQTIPKALASTYSVLASTAGQLSAFSDLQQSLQQGMGPGFTVGECGGRGLYCVCAVS